MTHRLVIASLAVLSFLMPAAPLLAHHSLANYDTTTAVHVKGTVVEFQTINPHSLIFVDEARPDGTTRRWAIEGPSLLQFARIGFARDGLRPGDVVEACGYLPKESAAWVLNGETLTMPDGHERSWGDYGVHKCFPEGHRDQHSK